MENKKAKKFVKKVDKVVDLLVVVFLLAFLLYGGYAMWDTNQMYSRASSSAYTAYRPSQETSLGFHELQAINPDVFGWITVFGTYIDYPLLQGADNFHYVHTNARGEPARSGAIFLDVHNNQDLSDFNNIIYGHDMTRNAMFGQLARFEDEYFFETRPFGVIYNGQRYYGIEFFAFLLADAHDFEIYNPTVTDEELKTNILNRFRDEAIQYRELASHPVTINDRLVVLSTCTQVITNGRFLLVGRLIDDIPEDLFIGESAFARGVDQLMMFGPLGLFLGAVFIIMVTVSVTLMISKKQKRKKAVAAGLISAEDIGLKKKQTTLLGDVVFLTGKLSLVGAAIMLIFTFVFGFTQMVDASMAPAMQQGDVVLFQRFGANLIASDTIVINSPEGPLVRRVVGVAGDIVDITEQGLMINGMFQQESHIFEETEQMTEGGAAFPLEVPVGYVFVLGDSRARSRDSRIYGPVSIDDILGSVVTVIRGRNL